MLPELLRGPIAKGTFRTSLVLGMRLVVQAGTLLVVARMLGPQVFGAFAGISALAVILGTLSTFGTHVVLIESMSSARAGRHEVLAYAVPTTILTGSGLLGMYFLILLLALPETGISWMALAGIGLAEMLLQPLYGFPVAERLATGRVARSQLLQILPLALRLSVAAVVLGLEPASPVDLYAAGYFLASLAVLTLVSLASPDSWPPARDWRLPNRRELAHAAGFAASSFTSNGPTELDKTLAARLLPLATAGLYSAGARVIGAVTLPVSAMMLAAIPRLFREGQSGSARAVRLLRWIFAAAFAYSLVLAAALWLVAPAFDWLFGASYQGLDVTIRWLCLAVPGLTLRLVTGTVLVTLDRPWMRVGYEMAGLVVLVVAAMLLVPANGVSGMALALALSEWAMALIGIIFIFKCTASSLQRSVR